MGTPVRCEEVIDAPIELVRRHFWDMPYHERKAVHAGARFEVERWDEESCRYRQHTRVLGATLVDVLVNRWNADGELEAHTIAGPNTGMRTRFRFVDLDHTATRVELECVPPGSVLVRVLGPVVNAMLRRRFRRALAEDKRDLESGAYPDDDRPDAPRD